MRLNWITYKSVMMNRFNHNQEEIRINYYIPTSLDQMKVSLKMIRGQKQRNF